MVVFIIGRYQVFPQEANRRALQILGKESLLLTPDCGSASFADNPVSYSWLAECAEALSSR